MRSPSLSGVWITTVVSLIGAGACLLGGSGAVAEEPTCGVMDSDPAGYPNPDEFPLLPDYCFGPSGPGPNVCTDNGCIIDVLVVYTPAARAAAGGVAAISDVIDLAASRLNAAFVNSQIPSFVRVVGTAEVPYDETDDTYQAEPGLCLRSASCMPLAHVLRNELKADIVSLFVNYIPGGSSGYADAPGSFNVVRWAAAAQPGYWIFAHETGHNLGAYHEIPLGSPCYGTPNCHGYVRTSPPAFSTIVTQSGMPKIQYFSKGVSP